eukprot:jgi/Galph1/1002/GphlegSOOS_G5810.1
MLNNSHLKTLVIGYTCNEKKLKSFFEPFERFLQLRGHRLIGLDEQWKNDNQDKFDVIIQKRTDDMVAAFLGDDTAQSRMLLLEQFLSQNTLVIDPLDCVRKVITRNSLLEKIDEIVCLAVEWGLWDEKSMPIGRLWWSTLSSKLVSIENRQLVETQALEIPFPAIIKSLPACGIQKSHCMYIVRSFLALQRVITKHFCDTEQVVVQKLIPSEYLWKVYIIGEHIEIFCQPNCLLFDDLLGSHGQSSDNDWLSFDSQQLAHETRQYELSCHTDASSNLHSLLQSTLSNLLPVISKVLGLSLYGIDIIFDATSGQYYMIDINYFPTFHGVPHCLEKMNEEQDKLFVKEEKQARRNYQSVPSSGSSPISLQPTTDSPKKKGRGQVASSFSAVPNPSTNIHREEYSVIEEPVSRNHVSSSTSEENTPNSFVFRVINQLIGNILFSLFFYVFLYPLLFFFTFSIIVASIVFGVYSVYFACFHTNPPSVFPLLVVIPFLVVLYGILLIFGMRHSQQDNLSLLWGRLCFSIGVMAGCSTPLYLWWKQWLDITDLMYATVGALLLTIAFSMTILLLESDMLSPKGVLLANRTNQRHMV